MKYKRYRTSSTEEQKERSESVEETDDIDDQTTGDELNEGDAAIIIQSRKLSIKYPAL